MSVPPCAVGADAPAHPGLKADALRVFAATLFGLGAVALLACRFFELAWQSVPLALALFSGIAALAFASLPGGHPHGRFGLANAVTTARAAMTALLASLLPEAEHLVEPGGRALAWSLTALTVLSLLLDGFDGKAARTSGLASRFGARYDMEVDALLVLVLSLFAFASGKAGFFVLAIGLMRYLFLGLLALRPELSGELAPSFRRKAVCVLQVGLLCALLAPPIAPPLSAWLAAAALAALVYSFAVDLLALARGAA